MTTPTATQSVDISAAVRISATMVRHWVENGQWDKLIMSPNTLDFLLAAINENTNPIEIEIPATNAELKRMSDTFDSIGQAYDEHMGIDQ